MGIKFLLIPDKVVGDGYAGIPLRDLTDEDWEKLRRQERVRVEGSAFYKKPKAAKKYGRRDKVAAVESGADKEK